MSTFGYAIATLYGEFLSEQEITEACFLNYHRELIHLDRLEMHQRIRYQEFLAYYNKVMQIGEINFIVSLLDRMQSANQCVLYGQFTPIVFTQITAFLTAEEGKIRDLHKTLTVPPQSTEDWDKECRDTFLEPVMRNLFALSPLTEKAYNELSPDIIAAMESDDKSVRFPSDHLQRVAELTNDGLWGRESGHPLKTAYLLRMVEHYKDRPLTCSDASRLSKGSTALRLYNDLGSFVCTFVNVEVSHSSGPTDAAYELVRAIARQRLAEHINANDVDKYISSLRMPWDVIQLSVLNQQLARVADAEIYDLLENGFYNKVLARSRIDHEKVCVWLNSYADTLKCRLAYKEAILKAAREEK